MAMLLPKANPTFILQLRFCFATSYRKNQRACCAFLIRASCQIRGLEIVRAQSGNQGRHIRIADRLWRTCSRKTLSPAKLLVCPLKRGPLDAQLGKQVRGRIRCGFGSGWGLGLGLGLGLSLGLSLGLGLGLGDYGIEGFLR